MVDRLRRWLVSQTTVPLERVMAYIKWSSEQLHVRNPSVPLIKSSAKN